MNSVDEFVLVVRDELGLPVSPEDAEVGFDELPGWDSIHLLWLLTILERRTGRSISLPDMLEASNLKHLYTLVVAE